MIMICTSISNHTIGGPPLITRKTSHPFRPQPLALALSTTLLIPMAAFSQAKADEKARETVLPQVKVEATAIDPNPNAQVGVPYKARTSGDIRHTRPLAETPQTITVITRAAIEESGASDLKEILDGQPGITLGTGENGNQFGDRYVIRGQEARSDVFVDGLRDPGMTTRESFAVEQLEISKGPNSSFAGRGTVGGAINAITKQATLDYDFARLSTGFGTDRHTRLTADVNRIFTDTFALRANVLYGYEEVPDRGPADRTRKGAALSGYWEATRDVALTFDYYGLRARDKPDLGSYLVGIVPNRVPATDVEPYLQDQDFLESEVDTFTARLKWKISPTASLNSLTRYGTSDNGYVVTGARSSTAFDGPLATLPYVSGTLSTHNGWQEVKYFAHQSNFLFTNRLFGRRNEAILGVEYTNHQVTKGTWAITNAPFTCRTNAEGTTNNAYCTQTPTGASINGLNSLLDRQITRGSWNGDWQIKTFALSAMDTIDITESLSLFTGLRFDRYDFDLKTRSNQGVEAAYDSSDTLVNGHAGLSLKVAKDAIAYATFSSAADINGGESDVGTSSGYGGAVIYNGQVAGADPEKSKNYEVGMKWDFLDHKLLFTAAAFQTTKSGVMEGANYDSIGTFNTGRNRVRGFEVGLVGNITERLTAQVGAAFMKSKVLASATATNVGLPLSNFADRSASAQLRFQATDKVAVGGAVRYESDKCAGQPDTGAGYTATGLCSQPVPAYTAGDVFVSYRFNKNLDTRINVLNVADKDYYTAAYRSGSFLYKGDGRAVRVTLNYEF